MPFRNMPIDGATLRRAGVIAAAVLASGPVVAAAAPRHEAAAAQGELTITLGNVFGGVTPQHWPVIVEVNDSFRRVTRTFAGIHLDCTSGDTFRFSDSWQDLRIKRGKFRSSYGPDVEPNDDGTTTTWEGSVSGKFNRLQTKVAGSWTAKATVRDPAGTVIDICDSGVVNWKAKD
jgi:hypothetical protein